MFGFFFFLYMVLYNALISLFSRKLSSFPSKTYWRYCLFSTGHPSLLCFRLIAGIYIGLLLGFLSCSIDLYVWLCANIILFYYSFVRSLKPGSLIPQSPLFLNIFWPFGVFCAHADLKLFCSSYVKKAINDLLEIILNL